MSICEDFKQYVWSSDRRQMAPEASLDGYNISFAALYSNSGGGTGLFGGGGGQSSGSVLGGGSSSSSGSGYTTEVADNQAEETTFVLESPQLIRSPPC